MYHNPIFYFPFFLFSIFSLFISISVFLLIIRILRIFFFILGYTLHYAFQSVLPFPSFLRNLVANFIKSSINFLVPIIKTEVWTFLKKVAGSTFFRLIMEFAAFFGGFPPEQPVYFCSYMKDVFHTRYYVFMFCFNFLLLLYLKLHTHTHTHPIHYPFPPAHHTPLRTSTPPSPPNPHTHILTHTLLHPTHCPPLRHTQTYAPLPSAPPTHTHTYTPHIVGTRRRVCYGSYTHWTLPSPLRHSVYSTTLSSCLVSVTFVLLSLHLLCSFHFCSFFFIFFYSMFVSINFCSQNKFHFILLLHNLFYLSFCSHFYGFLYIHLLIFVTLFYIFISYFVTFIFTIYMFMCVFFNRRIARPINRYTA